MNCNFPVFIQSVGFLSHSSIHEYFAQRTIYMCFNYFDVHFKYSNVYSGT